MSSWNNRRIRKQRKRQVRVMNILAQRIRNCEATGDTSGAARASEELAAILVHRRGAFRSKSLDAVRAEARAFSKRLLPVTTVRAPAPIVFAPKPEMREPKVHGVNEQRENRKRPTVGGARGKRA